MNVEGSPFVGTGMELILLVHVQKACANVLTPGEKRESNEFTSPVTIASRTEDD